MPLEMQRAFDILLAEYSVGHSFITPNASPLSVVGIVKTLDRVISMFGDRFQRAQDDRWEQLRALHERLRCV